MQKVVLFYIISILLFYNKVIAQCNINATNWNITVDSACGYQTAYPISNVNFNGYFSVTDDYFVNGNNTLNGKRVYLDSKDTFTCIEYGDTLTYKTRLKGINYNNFAPSVGFLCKTNLLGGGSLNTCNGISGAYGTIITNNQMQIYSGSVYLAGYQSQIANFNYNTNTLSNNWHTIKYCFNAPDAITNYATVSVVYDDSLMYVYSLGVGVNTAYRVPLIGASNGNVLCKLSDFRFYASAPFELDYLKINNNSITKYIEEFTSCASLNALADCNSSLTIAPTYISPNCINNQLQLLANPIGNFSSFTWTKQNVNVGNTQNLNLFNATTGVYTLTAIPINNCSNAIVKNINVSFTKSYYPKSENIAICQGQSIFLGGMMQTSAGSYLDTIFTNGYCDTIVTTTLLIKPNITTTINQSICDGQNLFGYTSTGTYVNTFTAANGCDSIRTLNLLVKPKVSTTINQSICAGTAYLGYTTAGVYVNMFTAANGCDSIRTLHLTIKPIANSTINKTICSGQSFEGYSTSGTYNNTFVAANGCDSIRQLVLTVNPPITKTIAATICEGQNYLGYTNTGSYTNTFTTQQGCDSIRILNLSVLPRKYTTINIAICQGENYFAGGNLQTTSGAYNDTAYTTNGCDSVITTILTVNPLPQPSLGSDKELCYSDNNILNPGNFASYVWQNASTATTFNANYVGAFSVKVKNNFGCTASDTMYVLNINPLPQGFLNYDTSFCRGNTITIGATKTFVNYLWNTNATTRFIPITNYGNYTLTVTDAKNCKATETIIVKKANCTPLVFPNAFSPNSDNNNDVFKPKINEPVTNYKLQIWNRYGQIIFESTDAITGWNGTFKSQQQPIGTYLFKSSFTDLDNKTFVESGEITLIR